MGYILQANASGLIHTGSDSGPSWEERQSRGKMTTDITENGCIHLPRPCINFMQIHHMILLFTVHWRDISVLSETSEASIDSKEDVKESLPLLINTD